MSRAINAIRVLDGKTITGSNRDVIEQRIKDGKL